MRIAFFLQKFAEWLWGIGLLAFVICPMAAMTFTHKSWPEIGLAVALGFGIPVAVLTTSFLLERFGMWWDDGRSQNTWGR